jgi:hypothetical protein
MAGSMTIDWTVAAAVVYALGVLLGLARIDAGPATRVALAVLWPLGPLAFVLTLTILIIASLIAFPLWGVGVVLVAALAWWLTR